MPYRQAIRFFFVIVSFRHKGLKLFWETGSLRGIQAEHTRKLRLILEVLRYASSPEDLSQPGFKSHPLKGDRSGFFSVWVSGNWRVTFRFINTDVELIDYEDYH